MSTDLFVSYSSRDRNRVMPLVEALRESGISIWIDEGNIHAADLWSEVIVQAIADATVIIVMLSRYSTDSLNVVKEVMLASEQNKTILPIYLEPAEIPPKLQYQLAGIQHVEITGQDIGSVVSTITACLSKRGISGNENNLQKKAAPVSRRRYIPFQEGSWGKYLNVALKSLVVLAVLCVTWIFYTTNLKETSEKEGETPKKSLKTMSSRLHLKIPIPEEYPLTKPSEMPFGNPLQVIEISNDGNKLILTCTIEGERYFCLRKLGRDEFVLLEETKGGFLPFFDPSGNSIAFFKDDKLLKLHLEERVIKVICETKNPSGGLWFDDQTIYFSGEEGFQLKKVSSDGGVSENVSWDGAGGFFPHRANNGKGLVFMGNTRIQWKQPHSLYLPLVDGDASFVDLTKGTHPTWVGEDQLVTLEGNYLQVQKIDQQTMQLMGQGHTIQGARIRGGRGFFAQYAMAQNGTLAFIQGSPMTQLTLVNLKPGGKPVTVHEDSSFFGTFKISPDGNRIAIEDWGGSVHGIKIFDIPRKQFSRINSPGPNYAPTWHPASQSIFYTSTRNEELSVYQYDLKSNEEKQIPLKISFTDMWINEFNQSTEQLILTAEKEGGLADFYAVDINQQGSVVQLTDTPWTEWGFTFSPDKKWAAYTSERDMKRGYEIYINRFPEMNQEIRLSESGGEEPDWIPDGSGIYYRNESKWHRVGLDLNGEQPQVTSRDLFFEGDYVNVWGPSHDIFPDGNILLLKMEQWEEPREIDIIVNALVDQE
ncbi:TIR domain-containing protein [Verrucomicrobia bacterium]|nr:TIR domain-containing protein [Verrucomicrobiota bacterium]